MSSRSEKSKNALRDKHQSILSEMLKEDANRLCADCCAKGPRWASWNIGVFVCIRCAGIHRNLGVHISKVKSVNLDSWTPVQMDHIVQWGNQRCKEVYECYLPKDFVRPQGDSAMETFIRSKYERKLYIIKGDISTAGLSANTRTSKQKQEDKPQTSATSKVERPLKVSQESKIIPKSKSSPPLMAPATVPTKVTSTQNPTSSSVDDLLSMGDFQGVNSNVSSSIAQSSNVDLFGLESCPDTFQSQIGKSNGVNKQDPFSLTGSTTTEQDLFSDDSTTKPVKSAKDTIMSLYTSNSSQQSSNVMYGVPGGVYMANNTNSSNQGSNYNNYQQYQSQPQFHGNSHFHQAPQGQMLPQQQQQQPLHHQLQQMTVNNGQMHYNTNQQYANNGIMSTGQQYQQPHPMSMATPMYAKNINNGMANQTMMQSNWLMPATNQQQPIVVNGNTSGMGMPAVNTNKQGSMGHTLSTQLWN